MSKKAIVKQIRDNVHGYIEVPEVVLHRIIDTPAFQRLRQIEQTSMRALYPGAHHDRFVHSLGVYHLGQLAYQGLIASIKDTPLYQDHMLFWDHYGTCFQLACLLHDCAHAPMSHSFEDNYLDVTDEGDINAKKARLLHTMIADLNEAAVEQVKEDVKRYFTTPKAIAPHELASAIVTGEYFRTSVKYVLEDLWGGPLSKEETAEYIQFMQRAIIGMTYEESRTMNDYSALEISFQNCLINLLNGNFFDVDKLDYIVRDSVQSGVNNVSIDIPRILKALTLVEIHTFKERTEVTDLVLNNSVLFTDCCSALRDIVEENDCECALELANVRLKGRINGELLFEKRGNHLKTSEMDVELNGGSQKLDGQSDVEVWFSGGRLMGQFIGQIETSSGGFNPNCIVDGTVHTVLSGSIKGTIVGKISTSARHQLSYAIGYSKSAMSVIEDTMIARNRLYLWIYAHHKVAYNDYLLRNSVLQALLPQDTSDLGALDRKKEAQKHLRTLMDIDNIFFKKGNGFLLSDGDLIYLIKRSVKEGKTSNTLAEDWLARKHMYAVWKSYAEYNSFFMNLGLGRRKDLWTLLFSGHGDGKFDSREANTDEYPDSILKKFPDGQDIQYMWIKPAGIKVKETDASKVYIVLSDDSVKRLKDVRMQEGISEQYADESFFYLYTSKKFTPEQKLHLVSFLKSQVMQMKRE